MPSSSIHEIYNLLFAGQRITVSLPSFNRAENLRVALQKKHRQTVAVDLSGDSLCMDWNKSENTAVFWLGERRKKQQATFEVISSEPVQESLAQDQRNGNESDNLLSSESPQDCDPGD